MISLNCAKLPLGYYSKVVTKLHDGHITYLCVLEVMPPERPDLVLATHVPHGETDIFKFYRLHIKTFTEEDEEEEALNTAKHWREPSKNHN